MKQKIYIYIAAVIATVMITGCENLYYDAYNSDNPDVYVVGYERGTASYDNALYWKNGNMHRLTNYAIDGDGPYAKANSVFVYQGKAYIAGTVNSVGVYSVDGGTPVEIAGCVAATSVFVYEGDIYIAGRNTSSQPDVWKNGISLGLPVALNTTIDSLFIFNKVVYAAGIDQTTELDGVYWDNANKTDDMTEATKTFLADNEPNPANSIFIYKGRIYIAGRAQDNSVNVACYWDLSTGNTPIFLSTVGNSYASSIFVSEGDVYVAGSVSSKAVYWENGQINYLSDSVSYTKSIFVYNNDVYVAGWVLPDGDHEVATYWKNGEAITLYDGTYNTQATSIFVSGD